MGHEECLEFGCRFQTYLQTDYPYAGECHQRIARTAIGSGSSYLGRQSPGSFQKGRRTLTAPSTTHAQDDSTHYETLNRDENSLLDLDVLRFATFEISDSTLLILEELYDSLPYTLYL